MSTFVRRSRRLPARVYWVRRGLLLAVVLLLGWGLARYAGADPAPEAVAPDPARTAAVRIAGAGEGATVSMSPARSSDRRPSRASDRPQRVRPVLGAPAGACDPAAVTVTPSVGGPVVAGTGVLLQLRLAVTAERACRAHLGNRLLVQVARDDEPVWTLTDCPSALATDTVVLHPGWMSVIDLAWSGRASNARCSVETVPARPGTYQLQAAMLGGEPAMVGLEVVGDAGSTSDEPGQT